MVVSGVCHSSIKCSWGTAIVPHLTTLSHLVSPALLMNFSYSGALLCSFMLHMQVATSVPVLMHDLSDVLVVTL